MQLENGYTRIANPILESIVKLPLNGTQFRIIILLWRQTYGFNRKECPLSLTYIAKATGTSKRFVSSELKRLVDAKIVLISKEATFTGPQILAFNKDFDVWDCSKLQQVNNPSTVDEQLASTGEQQFHSTGEQSFHQVKTVLKDNIKETSSSEQSPDIPPPKKKTVFVHESDPYKLATNLSAMMHQNNPDAKQQSETDLQRWAKDFDLMTRKDKRSPHDIYDVLYWAQNDSFWKSNILSAEALRKQYDRLKIQMNERR